MALLRILLLGLLILLVVRLAVRLVARLGSQVNRQRRARHGASDAQGGPAGSGTTSPSRPRQLVACPVCGTYFQRDRGLPVPRKPGSKGSLEVCSEACRARHGRPARDGGAR